MQKNLLFVLLIQNFFVSLQCKQTKLLTYKFLSYGNKTGKASQ